MHLVRDLDRQWLREFTRAFGLRAVIVADAAEIPGSYWGEPEAGLIGDRIYLRSDTPLHSLLHECGHYHCMTPERRACLIKDAGGSEIEEAAVCCLQVCLASRIPGYSRARLFADMDAWGYRFRHGSASSWFEADADDAMAWLRERDLIDGENELSVLTLPGTGR